MCSWVTQFVALAIVSVSYNDFLDVTGEYQPHKL